MRNTVKGLGFSLCTLALVGCASSPVGMDVARLQDMRAQGVAIEPVKAQSVSIKTKGQALGGMILGSVLGSVVGSPRGVSPEALQESQQVATQTSAVVQQAADDYSQKVTQPTTPATAMRDDLQRSLEQAGMAGQARAYHVHIQQQVWLLSYDGMFGSSNYRLHYQLDTELLDQAGKMLTHNTCAGDGKEKDALDAWKANDYAKVKAYAEQVGQQCSRQFLTDIGLPG